MSFAEKVRGNIEKLQSLPDNKKKIILWTIVAILAVVMGIFWIKGAVNTMSKIGGQVSNIKMPEIDTSNIPNIDLQKIQETINQNSLSNTTSPSNK